MELNCPACGAHFNVPDGVIGPKGRKVKCAKCGHTWHQMPLDQDSPAAPAEPPPAPAAAPAPPPPQPPEDSGPPVPMEMEPGERPGRKAAAAPAGPLAMDSDTGTALDDDIDDPLAGLDLGDDAGADMDDLDGLSSADAAVDDTDTDLDDLLSADPEPIPEMFAREEDDEEHAKGGKKGKVLGVLLGLLILVAIVAGGLYVGRSSIVRTFPEVEPYYAALGIHVDALGVGLRFNDVTSERLVRDGTDTLVVRGFIANTTSLPRDLPYLRLVLFDATDAPVQDMVAEPPQAMLEPGATTGFRVQLENPSAAARRFEVDWTKPPGAE